MELRIQEILTQLEGDLKTIAAKIDALHPSE